MQCLHIQTDIQCEKLFYLGKCTFSSPGQRSSELVIKGRNYTLPKGSEFLHRL